MRRDFSDLGRFQLAYSVVYTATAMENRDTFDFRIETERNGLVCESYHVILRLSSGEAAHLLNFLYENGIETGQAAHILHNFGLV